MLANIKSCHRRRRALRSLAGLRRQSTQALFASVNCAPSFCGAHHRHGTQNLPGCGIVDFQCCAVVSITPTPTNVGLAAKKIPDLAKRIASYYSKDLLYHLQPKVPNLRILLQKPQSLKDPSPLQTGRADFPHQMWSTTFDALSALPDYVLCGHAGLVFLANGRCANTSQTYLKFPV